MSDDMRPKVGVEASGMASLLPSEAVLEQLARDEGVATGRMRELLLSGQAAILGSHARAGRIRTCAVGGGLSTKVNANIGTSALSSGLEEELAKLDAAVEAGAHAVMDLSTGGDIRAVRRAILDRCEVPVGTVPIYEAAVLADGPGGPTRMTSGSMIDAVRRQAEEGVDFVTIHASITREMVESGVGDRRRTGIVSRGGALLAHWIHANKAENPFFERYDEILEICREHGVTISLGDALRPGCLADAGDEAQMVELDIIGGLVERARAAGVRVIVEGPGHVPLDKVAEQIRMIKERTHGAPLYVLGPLVTDVAPGHDHITSAIGGAVAAAAGADFLCYVTRAEHVCLPGRDEVREGVVTCRIAAHAGDIARGVPGVRDWDDRMADARKALDWSRQFELAIDGARPSGMRLDSGLTDTGECTMCGPLCAMRVSDSLSGCGTSA
jgi:phosphomethylpyrimidine synthase